MKVIKADGFTGRIWEDGACTHWSLTNREGRVIDGGTEYSAEDAARDIMDSITWEVCDA